MNTGSRILGVYSTHVMLGLKYKLYIAWSNVAVLWFESPVTEGEEKERSMGRALIKWGICCLALIILFLIFGDIGILFAVGIFFILFKYD